MKPSLTHNIYSLIIAAHPRRFRESFGSDMLNMFDEAAGEFNVAWLLWEAMRSVIRQSWVSRFRDDAEPLPRAVAGLRSGVYPFIGPSQMNSGKLLLATLLSVLLMQCLRV